MKVAFIIPHKGRIELLLETVRSIALLDKTGFDVEVVIVSQNPSLDLGEEFEGIELNIHLQDVALTISALRNFGSAQTDSEYLAFIDADIGLAENWLQAMKSLLDEDSGRVLVSAKQINSEGAPPLERIRTALSNSALDCNVRFLPGRNLFMARQAFEKVGGFPEHLTTCEDYYFTDQMSRLGNLYYSSKATYVHLGEDKDYKEMYKKEIWRGQSNLMSISGRKIPLEELPSFLVPIWILFFSIASVLSLLSGNIVSLLFSVFLVFLPIYLYSSRLFKLAKGDVEFKYVLKFYLYYFPARIIGTFKGLLGSFGIYHD